MEGMANNYEELKDHVGHKIVCVAYGDQKDPANVAIECETDNEVLLDFDKPESESKKTEQDDGHLKNAISAFIKLNRESIEGDEYAFARIKLFGPDGDSSFMNISLESLEAIAEVL